jgi:hypothetical protein
LPHLDKASVNEVYYEDAPAKTTTKAADGKEEAAAPEKVKKERSTVCIIKVFECYYGLPQNVLDVNIFINIFRISFKKKQTKKKKIKY